MHVLMADDHAMFLQGLKHLLGMRWAGGRSSRGGPGGLRPRGVRGSRVDR